MNRVVKDIVFEADKFNGECVDLRFVGEVNSNQ